MINYGLKEKAGIFWNHYSVSSSGTKEFQKNRFSIICVEKEGEREGRQSKPGRMGKQEGRKEGNGRMKEQKKISSVRSPEKTLCSLMSFAYLFPRLFRGHDENTPESLEVLTKVVP